MLTRLDLRGRTDVAADLPRPELDGEAPLAAVKAIIADVRSRGDDALRALTEKFDGVSLGDLRVEPQAVTAALDAIGPDLRRALESAAVAIEEFHRGQLPEPHEHRGHGLVITEVIRAVDRAGLYVPGGRACYPSTVLMTAVPARVAGVPEVALCVPPGPDGRVPTPTLAAAAIAGVDEVYAVGGAQAVAAMAYGTESIAPVDVIVGPGNIFVALAKREVAGVVGVPSAFAGPSEVVVVADDSAPVTYAAIDLLVQAEHGPDGLAWLVTWDEVVAENVDAAVAQLAAVAPRRDDIERTLERGGYSALVDGPEEAMRVVNAIAPEHLELMVADPAALVSLVRSAGAVFCGPWAPASVGDYLAGPSHVLPTNGSARFSSALRVDDFLKRIHVVNLDRAGLARVAPFVAAIADAEGLPAHAESVRIRGEG
jgi:histidinol dehydrogenase